MEKALAIQREVQKILGTDEVYLVGGSVRDLELGNEPKDYDFTTSMLPDEVEAAATAAGRHVYAIGKKFGTIGFKVPYLQQMAFHEGDDITEREIFEYVEVTTFRSEVYTSKSRKPEVQFVPSLDEDLARRDFTFNAMVLRSDGSIYDPYGGRLHIHAKKIQTVGVPKDRIMEDPLRMLRAARFAARYGFTIDPNFIGKARHLADRIYDVSVERWVQELDKLLTSEYAGTGILELRKMGLLLRILPEVDAVLNEYVSIDNVVINNESPDAAWKDLLSTTGVPYDLTLNAQLIKPLTKYINSGICARLKFSNARTDLILDKKKD